MPLLPPIRLVGARVLRDGALHDLPLTLADGLLCDAPAREVDLHGYLVLPGIIDLHGDGFERHLAPRPTAPFEPVHALQSVGNELAANGISTAWLAQSWSWEGGLRSSEATERLLAALDAARPGLLPDMRVQIRLETHVPDDHPRLHEAVTRYGIDYVVFNNHLPEALEMARHQPRRFAAWAAEQGRTPEALMALIDAAMQRDHLIPQALRLLAAGLSLHGIRLGSHDDNTAETRAFFSRIGATICEFPTSAEAAHSARLTGEPVLMGAPNVVRGGSQSGNIAASALIAEGLCDALVSDYYYPAMPQAAWCLADAGLMTLPRAWEMISTNPAAIMRLSDRGRLTDGLRADLAIVNAETRRIEATIIGGCLAHARGGAALRLMEQAPLTEQARALATL